jgi:antitoxin (DNA-binding transcriptional repressor) of toxin-antitoxin stability system
VKELQMDALRVPVAEADLPSLIERVAAGEQVVLTRDGEAVAELWPPTVPRHRSPEAQEAWRRLIEMRKSLPPSPPGVSSVDIINELRDEREEAVCPSISMRARS